MNDRIIEFMTNENLTATQFAEKVGVQRSNLSHIMSGRNKPGFEFIEKMLLAFPQLNADWLILGKGAMYKNAPQESSLFDDGEVKNVAVNAQTDSKNTEINTSNNNENMAKSSAEKFALPANSIKTIEKVIICYSDGTFDLFAN